MCMSGEGGGVVATGPRVAQLYRSGLCISSHCLAWCVVLILSRDSVHRRRDGQEQPPAYILIPLDPGEKGNSRDTHSLLGPVR